MSHLSWRLFGSGSWILMIREFVLLSLQHQILHWLSLKFLTLVSLPGLPCGERLYRHRNRWCVWQTCTQTSPLSPFHISSPANATPFPKVPHAVLAAATLLLGLLLVVLWPPAVILSINAIMECYLLQEENAILFPFSILFTPGKCPIQETLCPLLPLASL